MSKKNQQFCLRRKCPSAGVAGGPSWGGGGPRLGPQPPCAAQVPSPGTRVCPHTDTHGYACTPCASTDLWSLLGAPCPLPGFQGTCAWPATPPAMSSRAQGPLTSPAQGATAPVGEAGGSLGVHPPVNQECMSSQAGKTCEWPGGGWGVPGTGRQSRSPLSARCSPTAPPQYRGAWLCRCCPHPAPLCHRAGGSLGGSGSGPGRGAPSSCPGEAKGGQWKVLAHPRVSGVSGGSSSASPLGSVRGRGAPAVCCVGSVPRSCCTLP